MPETTPLIKAALNLRVGAGFDVYGISFISSILAMYLHSCRDTGVYITFYFLFQPSHSYLGNTNGGFCNNVAITDAYFFVP